VVSEVTVAEVLSDKKLSNDQVEACRRWFMHVYIARRPVTRAVSELAGKLRREHNIKRVSDAIILATAVRWEIPLFHTYDGEMLRLNADVTPAGVRIAKPNPLEDTLFDKNAGWRESRQNASI